MENENRVHEFIKKFHILKDSNQFNSVSIPFARTPVQVDYLKKCQAELESWKNNDETNIKIKYLNGDPQIVNF